MNRLKSIILFLITAALITFWASVVIAVMIEKPVSAPVALAWGIETVGIIAAWAKS